MMRHIFNHRVQLIMGTLIIAIYMASCGEKTEEATIVGTWDKTYASYFKVDILNPDGSVMLTQPLETLGSTFVFHDDGTVEAPWAYEYTYEVVSDSIVMRHEGWPDRVYHILSHNENAMELQRIVYADYYTSNDNGGMDTVVGRETEYWDLVRKAE